VLEFTPHRERRIVGPRGVATDANGVDPGAKPVDEIAGLGTGNPARVPGPVGDPAIDRGRELEGEEGTVGVAMPVEEAGVLAAGLFREQADLDLDPRPAQEVGATPGHRVGIRLRDDNLPDPGGADGIDAGRLFTLVGTGFEGDDQRAPAGPLGGGAKRHRFGVGPAELGVPSLADRLTLGQDDGAHQWIGRDPAPAPPGEFERAAHRGPVVHDPRPRA
jgi:hypothetical protein